MIKETVSAKEAAEMLGVNLSAVYQAAHADTSLEAVRCGKQIRLIKESVVQYQPRVYGDKRREGIEA